ncbi:hypothetical protein BAUCODRAFT_21663 [Baudoinia panamericana UAMH 10762]|uniref:Grh/CP2 DB domain-containing protein n=1 Tax=Baudoinia panamericana (strain UAMH 10762) TaxID=717646 RepID=M2NLF2_BAUPA|nr:uncharacterized protein BAUCODRAFT_21663 [Baudoinia panamericana UAMH 10762]EMC99980.1 hypothetical protein BAUCODRAFT_21663 [Baudoinia panamericana UAMH 10762]
MKPRCTHECGRCTPQPQIGRRAAQHAFAVWRTCADERHRPSQKPSDDLYLNFKANFPALNPSSSGTNASAQVATSLAEALDVPLHSRAIDTHPSDIKDADSTPRGSNEPWRFGPSGLTPSMMDPNSHTFNMFANQMPGYYTPTPGGTNTLYHNQAGDLHTPGFTMGLGTPLSMPTSESALHAGQGSAVFQPYHTHLPQLLNQPAYHNINPFHLQHQPAYAPDAFAHQPTYDSLDGPVVETTPVDDNLMDVPMQHSGSPEMLFRPQTMAHALHPSRLHPTGDSFRYHATLNAPTAMIKHADEIPVTYLNKGHAYTLTVVDTQISQPATATKYRTFVRVSFEDEQQRLKPAACWQLWKEGRGTNEAHQRGGRLQAVEFVEPGQFSNAEDLSRPCVELESASFDGFCVVWSPPAGSSECAISVRFNFLSTDFSHSKGVKGIPVRLCTKTELLGEHSAPSLNSAKPEVCYCKVKLFRDHGAERKLSNDVAHVKKTIDKINQQITQIESGMRDLGKRKRGSIARVGVDDRPGKVLKHRRTWSLSSVTSTGGRGSAEEDLHVKLVTLQDMFTSTRPISVLYLRGDDQDDPDLYPVKLSGETLALIRTDTAESTAWDQQSAHTGPPSSLVSPSPSSQSLSGSRRDSNLQQPTPFGGPSRVNSSEWRSNPQTALTDMQPAVPQQLASPLEHQQPVKVQTLSPNGNSMPGWVEAIGVDPAYEPPPPRAVKPVACFYVQPRVAERATKDHYYRAVYLMQRTLKDFVNSLAMKCDIEPTSVLRTVRISRHGLHILFDEECIRELPEGQDMTAEFCEIRPDSPNRMRREWDAGPTDIQCDGDVPTVHNTFSSGYELRLLF